VWAQEQSGHAQIATNQGGVEEEGYQSELRRPPLGQFR
jgi:hypothetical protein